MTVSPLVPRRHVASINPVDNPRRVRHSGTMGKRYAVGDSCWIRLIGVDGVHPGTVAAILNDDSVTHDIYVIRLDNYTWPQYEVRDATLMGASEAEILPMQGTFFQPGWTPPGVQ